MQPTNGSEGARPPARGRLLLICSTFFSYHRRIADAFADIGYDIVWIDDRASNHVLYKGALRAFPKVIADLSTSFLEAKLASLDSEGIRHVVVVRGEGLSPR